MEGMKHIQLTQGKQTTVDDDLYDWLNQWKWYYKGGYSCRNEYTPVHQTIRMHVIVNQTPEGSYTDHINGDKLDNRRANLRTVNRAQNGHNQGMHRNNTSGYKNIYWHKRDQCWRVQIRSGAKKVYIGSYADIEDAVLARNKAELEHHKEFGRT